MADTNHLSEVKQVNDWLIRVKIDRISSGVTEAKLSVIPLHMEIQRLQSNENEIIDVNYDLAQTNY